LRFAVTEGEVLNRYLEQTYKHILWSDIEFIRERVTDLLVELLLLIASAPFSERYLDDDDPVGTLDPEKRTVVDQTTGLVFSDDLEVIIFRDPDRIDHRAMHRLANTLSVVLGSRLP
jgi:hypothetical protein